MGQRISLSQIRGNLSVSFRVLEFVQLIFFNRWSSVVVAATRTLYSQSRLSLLPLPSHTF